MPALQKKHKKSSVHNIKSVMNTRYGPSDRIRTCGILLPKQARYQLRYTRLLSFLSGWSYSPKPGAIPTSLYPDIQFLPLYHGGRENQRFFCLWSFLWSKPLLCRFRQPGKIPQSQALQGFAAFRHALSRIAPRHPQSRRATSCATPGYVLFSAAACVCTHFKRKRCFLPHPFSAIALSSRVRFQTAQAANLNISQFA